RRRRWRERQ
nr:Chain C, HIV-1 Rev (41-49) [Human immunodeficiency virus 1]